MKKVLKITGITLLSLTILLIAAPFIFQSQIKSIIKDFINENLNAQVEFSDVSLSFIKSFPQAHVTVNDLIITNFDPFKDETLASVKDLSFTMSVKELFKSANEDPIVVNSITVDEAMLTLKTNTYGNTNYDISKQTKDTAASNSDSFKFDIQEYLINNSAVTYIDESSNTFVYVSELNHSGTGIFSAETSELDTHTDAHLSISSDSTVYLNNSIIKLDALIGLDLSNDMYTFKNNKGFLNQLPLEFQGFIKLLKDGQDIDITFENPGSSFKDFLAVLPEAYSKNLDIVETTGNFKVSGIIKGLYSEKTIPNLDIKIHSDNASFKYPDLPKRVENITIDTQIKNTTGQSLDTYIAINALHFKIDQDDFKSSATIKNLTGNIAVNATIDGVLNLANIKKVYPISLERDLSGILKANIKTSFDMNAIENSDYERIKNSGTMSLSNFNFTSEDFANPIDITEAFITFNTQNISLNRFKAKTGASDLDITGNLKNLLGFLLSNKDLQGNFDLNSNLFALNDFMTQDISKSAENNKKASFKIPAFLDCTINAEANTVLYDNLSLKNVRGTLIIKDEQAILKNLTSSLFDGQIEVSGLVSTKTSIPTFNMDLGVSKFDISKSFQGLEFFQNMAPIAKAVQGKLNSKIKIKGDLNNDFTPNLNSLSGDVLAEIISSTINPMNTELLEKMDGAFSFIDLKKLNLNDLKTKLEFNEGNVAVKPFNIKYQDINIEVSGNHKFDKTLSYNAVLDIPAKYLGSDINRLIGKIDDASLNAVSIPVTANITGTFFNPNVKTDLTSGVAKLTNQLIEIEKQKLINKGTDKVSNLLGDLLNKQTETADNKTNETQPKDSITPATKNTVEKEVKNVLGGLLNSKKKKKDTIN
jgi:hypothetical protein